MQFPDGQGLVHIVAGAFTLAGVVANPTAHAGKGMILFKKF